MNPILQEAIGKLIRYGLMILAGYLVKRGIWSEGDAASYVAAAASAIIALGWSVWVSYSKRVKFMTALSMPAGSTENQVKAVIKSGVVTPSITTPPDTIPGVPLPAVQQPQSPAKP